MGHQSVLGFYSFVPKYFQTVSNLELIRNQSHQISAILNIYFFSNKNFGLWFEHEMKIFLKFGSDSKKPFHLRDCDDLNGSHVKDFIAKELNLHDFYLCSSNGIDFDSDRKVCAHDTFIVCPKQLGGKVRDNFFENF
jgi:hypothetical protein